MWGHTDEATQPRDTPSLLYIHMTTWVWALLLCPLGHAWTHERTGRGSWVPLHLCPQGRSVHWPQPRTGRGAAAPCGGGHGVSNSKGGLGSCAGPSNHGVACRQKTEYTVQALAGALLSPLLCVHPTPSVPCLRQVGRRAARVAGQEQLGESLGGARLLPHCLRPPDLHAPAGVRPGVRAPALLVLTWSSNQPEPHIAGNHCACAHVHQA